MINKEIKDLEEEIIFVKNTEKDGEAKEEKIKELNDQIKQFKELVKNLNK